ncbi:BspA family leucine-rich repeat surface protein [Mycoplasma sp. 06067-C1-B144P-99-0482-3]|uniref:BspA family leucine-rich repeat surface protein n=1 Tax=Mycoplasma sp. 06067-C1-B144P-99-0482-3 TaxID=3117438 RepID=UPI003DA220E4
MNKKSKTNQEIENNSKIKQKSKSTPNKKLNKKAISYIMLASLWAGSGFGWFLYYYNHQKSVPVLRKGYEEQYYKELEKWLTPQQRKQREEFLKQAKEYEKQLKLEKEKRLEYASRHLVKFINDFDLGAINDNQDKTIISILENKFEQVKGQIRVDETFKTKEYARIIPIKNSKYHGEVTVNFTVKTKLDTVITNKHLDKFDNPDEQQIITKVNELNQGLELTNTDVEVEIKTDENKAIIKAKDSSSKYQGQVEVTFNIRPTIASTINSTSLGALLDNEKQSILNAINKTNDIQLTFEQVDIESINDTSAIVKAKENNNYQGEVKVTFTVKTKLGDVATQLNLGALFDKNDNSIFEAFKRLNNSVNLEQKDVDINVQHNKATITVKNQNDKYQGQVEVTFTIKTKLNTVITKLHLDKFDNPDEQQIITKVNELNQGLELTNTDVEVEIKTDENKAIIKAKDSSSKYQGQVEVTFNIRPTIASTINSTSLGALLDNEKQSILNAINKTNDIQLTFEQVDIESINDTSAIVKAKENNNYQGEVKVTFTVKTKLGDVATQLNLGALFDKNDNSIFEAFKRLNNSVNLEQKDVDINVQHNKATITVKNQNDKYQGQVEVTFTIKTKLNTVITKLHLDKFDNPDEQQIITKVNELNQGLELTNTDVEVEIKTDENKAIIKAKDSSSKYQGQVEVTFNIRPTIASTINSTSLGALLDNEKQSILNAINKTNDIQLTFEQVDIESINDTSAIVKAKENNNYQGEVKVTFTVKTKLGDVATQLNLGALFDKNDNSIFEAFKRLNNSVNLEQKDVDINVQHNKATITVKNQNDKYQGQVEVTFTIKTKLNTVITKLHLDKFDNPDEQQIITKVNELNQGLELTNTDVEVEIKTDENKAIIKAKDSSSKYQGQVEVTFNIRPTIASTINSTSLGALLDNEKQSILNAINKTNDIQLTFEQVDIESINDTSAIVKAKENNNYQGEVKVTFTVKTKLGDVATQLNLGALFDKNDNSIFEAFKRLNNSVNLEQKDVDINVQHNKATITVKNQNDKYQGQVEVTFTIKTKLNTVITKLHLDKFDNPDEQQIITKVNELNQGLELTNTDVEVEIKTDENKAIIKAKDSSSKYQGQVEVTFNIRPTIASTINSTSLGALLDNEKQSILNAINKTNDIQLTFEQVDIESINDTSAIVKAKENNNYQGEVTVNFTIKTKLQNIIRNTNLGYIKDNTSRTLLDLINSKNDWSMNENHIKLNNITNTSATITPKSNGSENKYQGQVIVNFTIKTKLQDIIKNTDLGYIKEKNFNSILKAINEKNPGINLTSSDIAWRSLQRGQQVEIYPETNSQWKPSNKYQGEVIVTFKIKEKLQEIIRNTDLGYIKDNTSRTLLDLINSKNDWSMNENHIKLNNITNTSATITPKSNGSENKYQGQVIVNFTIKTKLQDIIKNTDLGYIKEKNFNSILKAINEKNPGINLTSSDIAWRSLQRGQQVEIYPETNSQWKPSNKYQGEVIVTFNTKAPWKGQPHKYDGTKVIEIGWITLDDGTVQIPTFNKYTTEVPAYLPPFITNLNGAFSQLESSSVKNLDKWDTSNVTNMRSMFIYAEKFNQPIGNWNTSNVTNMKRMFYGAKNFNQPIGNWDTSNVTNMEFMFYRADAFNQDISNWNVNNVTKWSHFDWNYGNYYRKWQIPEKFR